MSDETHRVPLDVRDVAAYILTQFDSPISTMKLQKLVFFSQGWALVLLKRRLVDTDFEAWKWGPVSFDLYREHRRQYGVSEIANGDSTKVTGNNKIIIDAVLRIFGGLSGMQLGDLTHMPETPWTRTRQQHHIEDGEPSRVRISDEVIKNYFAHTLMPK